MTAAAARLMLRGACARSGAAPAVQGACEEAAGLLLVEGGAEDCTSHDGHWGRCFGDETGCEGEKVADERSLGVLSGVPLLCGRLALWSWHCMQRHNTGGSGRTGITIMPEAKLCWIPMQSNLLTVRLMQLDVQV